MGLTRLHGIDPGRIGVFAGPLWCDESFARGAFPPGAIYLAVDGMR
jgi:hypothetical protein